MKLYLDAFENGHCHVVVHTTHRLVHGDLLENDQCHDLHSAVTCLRMGQCVSWFSVLSCLRMISVCHSSVLSCLRMISVCVIVLF